MSFGAVLFLVFVAYIAGASAGWLARSLVAALDDASREFEASCDRIESRLRKISEGRRNP